MVYQIVGDDSRQRLCVICGFACFHFLNTNKKILPSFRYICYMQVRKTTFEKDLEEKEKAFLALSGEERIRLVRLVNDRTRKAGINYELKNQKVIVRKFL
jgi:hypothetical protein